MANKGICNICGGSHELDDKGNLVDHTRVFRTAYGGTRKRCSGSGKKPNS